MEDRIFEIKCPVIISILIFFLSISSLSYYVAMTILELKVDQLSEFLNATSIQHIFNRSSRLISGLIYPKFYKRPHIGDWVFGRYSYSHLFFFPQVFQARQYLFIRQPIIIYISNYYS